VRQRLAINIVPTRFIQNITVDMKRLSVLLGFLILLIAACKKDEFPDEFSLLGKWIEVSSETDLTEIEFQNQNRVLIKLRNDTVINYRYMLNKANELELFTLDQYPEGDYTTHKITYDKQQKKMTIFGLYPAVSGIASETVFRRK